MFCAEEAEVGGDAGGGRLTSLFPHLRPSLLFAILRARSSPNSWRMSQYRVTDDPCDVLLTWSIPGGMTDPLYKWVSLTLINLSAVRMRPADRQRKIERCRKPTGRTERHTISKDSSRQREQRKKSWKSDDRRRQAGSEQKKEEQK